MQNWVDTSGLLAVVAAVAAASTRAVRAVRRRRVPQVPLRRPVAAADQDRVRALVAQERDPEAVELLRRHYGLTEDDARAVAGDVTAHPDYPVDWCGLAAALDDGLRSDVRRLVAQGRRSAALRTVRSRFGLTLPDADRLVSALDEQAPGDGA